MQASVVVAFAQQRLGGARLVDPQHAIVEADAHAGQLAQAACGIAEQVVVASGAVIARAHVHDREEVPALSRSA
jgi:hypothetical protein